MGKKLVHCLVGAYGGEIGCLYKMFKYGEVIFCEAVIVAFQPLVLYRQCGGAVDKGDPFVAFCDEEADELDGADVQATPDGVDVRDIGHSVKEDHRDII